MVFLHAGHARSSALCHASLLENGRLDLDSSAGSLGSLAYAAAAHRTEQCIYCSTLNCSNMVLILPAGMEFPGIPSTAAPLTTQHQAQELLTEGV